MAAASEDSDLPFQDGRVSDLPAQAKSIEMPADLPSPAAQLPLEVIEQYVEATASSSPGWHRKVILANVDSLIQDPVPP